LIHYLKQTKCQNCHFHLLNQKKKKLEERRNEVLKSKGITTNDIGSYTYDELQQIFGKENFDIIITRDLDGVKMRVGKKNNYKEEKNNKDE
jgi:hypothetical protein